MDLVIIGAISPLKTSVMEDSMPPSRGGSTMETFTGNGMVGAAGLTLAWMVTFLPGATCPLFSRLRGVNVDRDVEALHPI
jgi:hypothetical protein